MEMQLVLFLKNKTTKHLGFGILWPGGEGNSYSFLEQTKNKFDEVASTYFYTAPM